MPNIGKIDKNMKSKDFFSLLKFTDVRDTQAKIYGLIKNEYHRLPKEVRQKCSKSLLYLENNLSGGRVRFKTNSKRLGIKVWLKNSDLIYNFSYIGFCGIDSYIEKADGSLDFLGVCCPQIYKKKAKAEFSLTGKDEEIILYLPLYNSIEKLEIGVDEGAYIKSPKEYEKTKPLVFYGSSITQGGCASRAGNSYCALVSRWLKSDFYCYGFSGNAKGEAFLAQYLSQKEMSAFIYDYDFNAPSLAHLKKTHMLFIKTILEEKPNLPVVMMSKPSAKLSPTDSKRRDFIKKNCEELKNQGYNTVFIDGETLFSKEIGECCTVDGIHPNDLGFYCMAKRLYPILKEFTEE